MDKILIFCHLVVYTNMSHAFRDKLSCALKGCGEQSDGFHQLGPTCKIIFLINVEVNVHAWRVRTRDYRHIGTYLSSFQHNTLAIACELWVRGYLTINNLTLIPNCSSETHLKFEVNQPQNYREYMSYSKPIPSYAYFWVQNG